MSDLQKLETSKDEEIARLKELLAFVRRGSRPSSVVRVELDCASPANMRLCVTSPGADEEKIARIAIRHLRQAFQATSDMRVQGRVCAAVQPVIDALENCDHLDGGVCRKCAEQAVRQAATIVNVSADDDEAEDEAPKPEGQP